MASPVAEPCCSFCHAPRSQRKRLIEGLGGKRPVFICNLCVCLAQTPFATVAYCASCKPVNGKHEKGCPEEESGAA